MKKRAGLLIPSCKKRMAMGNIIITVKMTDVSFTLTSLIKRDPDATTPSLLQLVGK